MGFIKTKLNPGDRIWWVHCSCRVYEGTIEDITCCDYQGFLYCLIASPKFKVNPYPVVHYSNVFKTKEEAKEYAKYQKRNPDGVLPMCMSCHYNDWLKQPADYLPKITDQTKNALEKMGEKAHGGECQ